ncbi:DivIVA domain-containing protein [Actinomycetospora succinea]|uniref:DivIVA domain-containing protein n=1 Tax=Actinomycetospora succinea TaxID=663603 RepID=A0A4R6VS20_9PSEU|nr:DivIVA domain-containing protein [Actinomycetospora succinea]TDQ65280.1 DivIVA domain-containing protein [Actinomycetospora succinea]
MPSDEHELLPLGTGFDVVRRGYDRGQVEEHLDRVEADLRILTADRDAAVAQATELARALDHHRAHVEDLRAQVDRLSAPPDTMEGLSERLQRMLRLAQDETRSMRDEAADASRRIREEADEYARRTMNGADEHARKTAAEAEQRARQTLAETDEQARAALEEARGEARAILERAEAEADQARHRYDDGLADNERRRHAMEEEHRNLMDAARAEAAHVRQEAEQERERLDTEGRATREQVENDFAVAMAARRREAMRQLEADEKASRERADKYVGDASEEARRRLREADAEVADMKRLRDRVGQQLNSLRAALGALPTVESFPDEAPGDGRPVLPDPPTHANGTHETGDLGGAAAPEQRSAAPSR